MSPNAELFPQCCILQQKTATKKMSLMPIFHTNAVIIVVIVAIWYLVGLAWV